MWHHDVTIATLRRGRGTFQDVIWWDLPPFFFLWSQTDKDHWWSWHRSALRIQTYHPLTLLLESYSTLEGDHQFVEPLPMTCSLHSVIHTTCHSIWHCHHSQQRSRVYLAILLRHGLIWPLFLLFLTLQSKWLVLKIVFVLYNSYFRRWHLLLHLHLQVMDSQRMSRYMTNLCVNLEKRKQ